MHSVRVFSSCILLASHVWLGALSAQQIVSSAVDIKGQRHSAAVPEPWKLFGPRRLQPAWIADLIKYHAPEYPTFDLEHHNEGDGLFRITVDPKTGSISHVTTIKSTGFASLDNSAVTAIREWRWKPGTWKEVDMPVRFQWYAR
jgi:TonB family protein